MDKTRASLPMLLTVDDAAGLLRTTRRAVYAMVERRQLPALAHEADHPDLIDFSQRRPVRPSP